MMSLAHAARLLGGEVSRGQVLCPGPNHSAQDRSLSVQFHGDAPDGFIVHSFAADGFLACREHVRRCLGIHDGVNRFNRRPQPERRAVSPPGALGIWSEARNPIGTPAETYLAKRGLRLPAWAPGAALRFHPSCPFNGTRTPAMIALVRDIATDRAVAIHRTALTVDGRKSAIGGENRPAKDRMALGPIASGAVKLSDEVTTVLGIGEGIESTMSLQLIPQFGASPIWSLLCAGNLERLPVLSGVDVLWIAVDNDATGIEAAQTVASRWREAEREVYCVQSTVTGDDLNDVVKERAHEPRGI